MTEAIINLQALLVKSYHHEKPFPLDTTARTRWFNPSDSDLALWFVSGLKYSNRSLGRAKCRYGG